MELGLGSYAFRWATSAAAPRKLTCAQMVEETAAFGCSVLQIADNDELGQMDAADLSALRVHATAHGVRLEIGCTGARFEVLTHYLEVAQALEAELVRVVLHEDTTSVDNDAAARMLAEVAPAYESAAVRIGIENHFLTTSPQLIQILRIVDSPSVGVMLDVANSIVCGEWPQETVASLAPFAIGLHLKDYDIEPDADGVGAKIVGRPLGQGRTRIEDVFNELRAAGRADLAVILEQWSPRGIDIEESIAIEARWRADSVQQARRFITTPKEALA